MKPRIDKAKVAARLVDIGQKLFDQPRERINFTRDRGADDLLNDIERRPHLFVLGCVVDRQIKAERAWLIPIRLAKIAGGPGFTQFETLTRRRIERVLAGPPALHRFPSGMAAVVHSAISRIRGQYGGNASRIWRDRPSSAEVVYRFLEFDGVGPKIATMAANILARQFKVPFSDYYSIDVSADVHVRRVFGRLGLVGNTASVEQIVYRARDLNPAFPGLLDRAAFWAGRNWCKPVDPLCGECDISNVCPTGAKRTSNPAMQRAGFAGR